MLKGEEVKDIPKHIYNKGCKFFMTGEEHPLLKQAIKLFNGKILRSIKRLKPLQ